MVVRGKPFPQYVVELNSAGTPSGTDKLVIVPATGTTSEGLSWSEVLSLVASGAYLVTPSVDGSPGDVLAIDSVDPLVTEWVTAPGGPGGAGGYTYVQDEADPPASPDVNETWFAPDTGITYLRYDDGDSVQWIQTASADGNVAVLNDPTLMGTVTHDGPRTYLVRSAGGGVYLSLQSDTANYLTFEDEAGNSLGYIDVPKTGGTWTFRNAAGDPFIAYDDSTGEVTFPDGGVPASEIIGAIDGGTP